MFLERDCKLTTFRNWELVAFCFFCRQMSDVWASVGNVSRLGVHASHVQWEGGKHILGAASERCHSLLINCDAHAAEDGVNGVHFFVPNPVRQQLLTSRTSVVDVITEAHEPPSSQECLTLCSQSTTKYDFALGFQVFGFYHVPLLCRHWASCRLKTVILFHFTFSGPHFCFAPHSNTSQKVLGLRTCKSEVQLSTIDNESGTPEDNSSTQSGITIYRRRKTPLAVKSASWRAFFF